MNTVGEVVSRHPWAFIDEVENGVLMGLGHIMTETVVGMESDRRIYENAGFEDVSRKLLVRRAAARFSYRLFSHYRSIGDAVPETIRAWEAVCRSEDEFWEIRNQWLAPQSPK